MATVVYPGVTREEAARAAMRIRQIGPSRVLYGSDTHSPQNLAQREAWAAINATLPLTQAELRTIATNIPPYLR